MFDQVTLDYELKTLATQIELARSLNRSASIRPEIFSISDCGKVIQLTIRTGKSNYQIQQNAIDLREVHNLSKGFSITASDRKLLTIRFDSAGQYFGNSGVITLKSPLQNQAQIIFDSVGRWRGARE